MKELAVKAIINNEKLTRVNWYQGDKLKENQVGIKKENSKWVVYVTDERANIVDGSTIEFDNDEEAYNALIRKARYGKKKFG
ncbi:hypothetical protein [Caproiciproducens galactitolivorans]|uniref:Uncharacterized protein n=1 Tax=Caproiciproducens galactitolivorans TaxID=642589 RepID=A0ABT4BXV2_9FIRM|nr:hypothetical protein [Caproiciproducens galactitolivorans]MCY1714746.1 hypothetical protein [Caproiciproducens galactitolivorans]